MPGWSGIRLLTVMSVADGSAKLSIQPLYVDDHFLGVNRFHRAEWNDEITGVFHIDDDLRSAIGQHLSNRPELGSTILNEDLITDLDQR